MNSNEPQYSNIWSQDQQSTTDDSVTTATTNTKKIKQKNKLTIEEKRDIIRYNLATNLPIYLPIIFGTILCLIGLSGISLQICLIINQSINYEIGNGIWGGFFAILNGLIKINIGKSFINRNRKKLKVYFCCL